MLPVISIICSLRAVREKALHWLKFIYKLYLYKQSIQSKKQRSCGYLILPGSGESSVTCRCVVTVSGPIILITRGAKLEVSLRSPKLHSASWVVLPSPESPIIKHQHWLGLLIVCIIATGWPFNCLECSTAPVTLVWHWDWSQNMKCLRLRTGPIYPQIEV